MIFVDFFHICIAFWVTKGIPDNDIMNDMAGSLTDVENYHFSAMEGSVPIQI